MITLRDEKSLGNAIAKAKQLKPFVKPLGGRDYLVTSRTSKNLYAVRFHLQKGTRYADCSCKAGEHGMPCYHVASAVSIHLQRAADIVAKRQTAH